MRKMLLACCLLAACVDANGLERPSSMEIRTLQDGDTAKYAISWGPAVNATGYRVSTTVNAFGQSGNIEVLPSATQNVTSTNANLTVIPAATIESLQINLSVVGTRGSQTGPARTASWKWSRGAPGQPGPIVVDSSLAFNSLWMPDWWIVIDTVRANNPDAGCRTPYMSVNDGGLIWSSCLASTGKVYGARVLCVAAVYGETDVVTWARSPYVESCEAWTVGDSIMRKRYASAWKPEQTARDSVTFTLKT